MSLVSGWKKGKRAGSSSIMRTAAEAGARASTSDFLRIHEWFLRLGGFKFMITVKVTKRRITDCRTLNFMPAPSSHAFAEKVALITDGTNPVGRAVAMQLALYGCYVVTGFSQANEENRRALAELKNLGTLANSVEADVSTVEGAKILVGEVEKMFGRIDLLVNTLKFAGDSTFEEMTEEFFDKTVDTNLKSVFFVTQAALPLMKSRPKPKIVYVVSACDAEETKPNLAFIAAQKAVTGLTGAMAKRLPENFRVNTVAVSEREKQTENLDTELFRRKSGIAEDDVARTVLYLLSSEAIGINGQVIAVG